MAKCGGSKGRGLGLTVGLCTLFSVAFGFRRVAKSLLLLLPFVFQAKFQVIHKKWGPQPAVLPPGTAFLFSEAIFRQLHIYTHTTCAVLLLIKKIGLRACRFGGKVPGVATPIVLRSYGVDMAGK